MVICVVTVFVAPHSCLSSRVVRAMRLARSRHPERQENGLVLPTAAPPEPYKRFASGLYLGAQIGIPKARKVLDWACVVGLISW